MPSVESCPFCGRPCEVSIDGWLAHCRAYHLRADDPPASPPSVNEMVRQLDDALDDLTPEEKLEVIRALRAELHEEPTRPLEPRPSWWREVGVPVVRWVAIGPFTAALVVGLLAAVGLVCGERIDWDLLALAGVAATLICWVVWPLAALRDWLRRFGI